MTVAKKLTTPLFGIDSYGATPVSVHHEIGSHFAGRYLSHEPGKHITGVEYEDDKTNDIGLIGVFEDSATNALKGYDQGKADAEFAAEQAKESGMPDWRPIYFAVDADVSGDSVSAYFDGAAAVLGRERCGPYGSYGVVAYLMDKGFAWAWQTYAWSEGKVDERAQVLQYSNGHTVGGYGVDFNHAFFADYGQWDYAAPAPVNRYGKFYAGPFKFKDRVLHERALVQEYDELMKHPRRNARKLEHVKALLKLDLERIASKASIHREPGKKLPAAWTPFHRGERYTLIAKRVKGEVIK